MSEAATPTSRESRSAQVFRRRTTVVASLLMVGALVVLAAVLTPGEYGHGAFSVLAASAGALPLAMFALIAGASPHVVVDKARVAVHNSFFCYDVPYPAIDDVRQTRLGLILRTNADRTIPMTAYSGGSGAKALGHEAAANEVIHAIENAMEFVKPDPDARVVRHVETRNVVAATLSVVICVVVVFAAVQTYH